ncbi:tripartite tricarboxylate transporter substrate binding protein [Telmatospirillum sp. J64-1]|uniref:Bug family tripartite tricarboxylate transporter substrate binding protein n=1 Tax=Telmatospirillum sp. J64-1 TaxID=2502183 RepID=UPI00115D9922|nr:tripartite tricarboxylate transporter substrate-binding protein [Telmatospirillum sp. J64-1]
MKTFAFAALALGMLAGVAHGQENFPNRPVTLVIPYGPGGSTDLLGRQLAAELQKIWGQPVVVENRTGAGSMIGTAYLAQSQPDGYTLLFNTAAHVTAPAIYTDLPFDPETDITPVAMLSYSPFLMVAGSGVKSERLEDLLVEAEDRPMFVATAGLGSSSHFAAELFVGQSGLDMDIVHYSGGGEALTDLMGGHSDLYISSTASSMAAVAGQQVKPIGILGIGRYDSLPETQSTAEVGIETPDIRIWQGIFGPGGMPRELVEKINADITKVLENEEFLGMLSANYTMAATATLDEFQAMVAEEMDFWRKLAKEREITKD